MGLTHVSLFTGLGGWEYAFQLAEVPHETILYCEINPYRQEVIRQRIRDGILRDAPIWPDVRTLDGRPFAGRVGILTASFLCKMFSVAGRRLGASDARNTWPDTARIIAEMEPRIVLLENVPGIAQSSGGEQPYALTVLSDLARLGYVGWAGIVSARDVGASHRRDRWWVLAYDGREYERLQQRTEGTESTASKGMDDADCGDGGSKDSARRNVQARTENTSPIVGHSDFGGDALERAILDEQKEVGRISSCRCDANGRTVVSHAECARLQDGNGYALEQGGNTEPERFRGIPRFPPGPNKAERWASVLANEPSLEPAICGMADGIPHRRQRLEALGDGLVPAVAAEFLRIVGGEPWA